MKLDRPFILQITGDPTHFRRESLRRSEGAFAHLMDRLFSGEEVRTKELESWGIVVTVIEPDEFVVIPRHPDS